MEQWAHPSDGQVTDAVTPVACMIRYGHMLLRIGWKVSDAEFIPMTFVCTTGMTESVYLSQSSKESLQRAGLVYADETREGAEFVRVCGRRMPLLETPERFAPANMLGLSALMALGLSLHSKGFSFTTQPPYF
jgi:hypothetical protein